MVVKAVVKNDGDKRNGNSGFDKAYSLIQKEITCGMKFESAMGLFKDRPAVQLANTMRQLWRYFWVSKWSQHRRQMPPTNAWLAGEKAPSLGDMEKLVKSYQKETPLLAMISLPMTIQQMMKAKEQTRTVVSTCSCLFNIVEQQV